MNDQDKDKSSKPATGSNEPPKQSGGFFDWLFGTTPNPSAGTTRGDNRSGYPYTRSQAPASPSRSGSSDSRGAGSPTNRPGSGSAPGNTGNGAAPGNAGPATTGGDGRTDLRPTYQPDPDRPLDPHSFTPRIQALGNMRIPRVLISPEAYKRMQLYVELARKEVGWLGTCTRLENGDFFIDMTFLLEQEVTATETELSVEGQNKLVNELITMNGDAGLEQVNSMRFWGHSHVRMGTSPSGTDERTMERWQSEGLPWAVRGIFNKLGRAEFTLYLYEDGYRICDAPWAVMEPTTKRIILQQRSHRYGGGGSYTGSGGYFGGQRPSYEEPRGWWGVGSSRGGYGSGYFNREEPAMPAELVANEALRNEVTADFAAKVSERLLILSGWFNREKEQQDIVTGDGPPVAQDDDRTPIVPSTVATTGGGYQPFSLWRWLVELFSTDSTPPASTEPASPPPAAPPRQSPPAAPPRQSPPTSGQTQRTSVRTEGQPDAARTAPKTDAPSASPSDKDEKK